MTRRLTRPSSPPTLAPQDLVVATLSDLIAEMAMMRHLIRLLVTLTLGLLLPSLVALAQPPTKIPRIGVFMTGSPATTDHYVDAFQHGLREHGYVEGQHIT